MERLDRREVLASNIGAIAGVAFTDQAGDGLTSDDPRLEGVTVELYSDDGSGNAGSLETSGPDADTLVATDTTATSANPVPGQYRFDGLSPGDYWVVQSAVSGLVAPSEQLVTVTNDGGVQLVQIDDYSTTGQTVTATNASPDVSDSSTAPEAIGGARDVQATNSNSLGQVTVFVDETNDQLAIGSLGDGEGTGLIQYDGPDGAITLDATGLSNVALGGGAAGGAVAEGAGLHVVSRADTTADSLTINVYTDAANFSTTTLPIPVDASTFIETFVPFDSFTVGGGTGADFNDVGAIEASLSLSANNDVFVSIVESLAPDVVTQNLANVQPLTLGGQLFLDTGSGSGEANNGELDSGESGVTVGTTVELYQVAGEDDVVDVGVDSPIVTTTTGADGTYSFSGLDPGNYVVVVPESEFQTGQELEGLASSTGNDPANDPDDNVDGDDNGTFVSGLGVASGTITLVSNSEPIDDADTDPNTNTTVDFGFATAVDLSITKSIDAANSDDVAGGTVVYDVSVTNNGPNSANDVEVEDVIPTGLTFDSIQNASGSFTPTLAGSTLTVALGSLADGATATFQIVADIDDGQAADVTNTATVSATGQVDSNSGNDSSSAVLDLLESDLQITKVDQTDPVDAGDQLVYTLTVTNNGPDTASAVVVTDVLQSGVDFVSGDVDGDSADVAFDAGTSTITATVGELANGATSTITLTVSLGANVASPITNGATVSSTPNTDPDPSNNTATEDTVVNRIVDVAIDKNISGSVVAGDTVTYTVEVSNSGPGDARGVTVTDTLDSSLTFDSLDAGSSGVTVSQTGQDLEFTVGTVASGATVSFTFDAILESSTTGTLDNTATVATTDSDSDSANDTDTVSVSVVQEVDLIVEKTVDLASAVPGQDQLVYTFTVSHDTDSISDASNVVISDVLPAGLSNQVITAATADATNFDDQTNTATVTFNSLPLGETRTFSITVDVDEDATGSIDNSATVGADGTELDSTNNTDTASTNLAPEFDVSITKTVGDQTPDPGESIAYTIEISNSGPSTATGVVLSDVVPSGLTFVSGSLDGQSGTLSGSTVEFPAISVDSGETVSGTLTFTVDDSTTGTVTNTASVATDTGETDTSDNQASDDITVDPVVDLAITKSVDVTDAAQPGSTLEYTITVDNNGPSTATNVEVVDTLPAGVTFVSGVGPDGGALSASSGVVTVDLGSMENGAQETFTINVTVNSGVTADQINSATVSSDVTDSDSGNDTAAATTTVDPETSSIAGSVYVDANENGTRDSGESGIEGVQVTLTGTDALGNTVSELATTDANGDYLFSNLASGTYRLAAEQPSGFLDGQEQEGTGASATVGNDEFTNLQLGIDTEAADFLFGELDEPLSKRRFLASAQG